MPARTLTRACPDVSSHLPISVSRSFKPVSYPQLDPHQCVSNLSPLSKNQTSPPERTNILGGFGKTLICAALSDVTDLPFRFSIGVLFVSFHRKFPVFLMAEAIGAEIQSADQWESLLGQSTDLCLASKTVNVHQNYCLAKQTFHSVFPNSSSFHLLLR